MPVVVVTVPAGHGSQDAEPDLGWLVPAGLRATMQRVKNKAVFATRALPSLATHHLSCEVWPGAAVW